MADRLRTYKTKRDFRRTPEPKGARSRKKTKAPRFVVHEHHARRLHWDLRLEREGVLLSWAVPNGIPDDPKENRLAVRTEDHPLEYIDFAGEIPAGEYGAGKIKIWDAGTYELEKFRDDELILTFHGEHLNGKYALIRTRDKDWLIHRMDPPVDPDREPMPEHVVPMLAKLGAELPRDQKKWAFEIKWDGIRAIAYSRPGRWHVEGRRLTDITPKYPELRPLGRELGSRTAVLDGEIVAFGEDGKPSFERLQHRMHLTGDSRIRRQAAAIPATYVIFDLLYLDGHSLMERPYEERRARLDELGLEGPNWRTPPAHPGKGKELRRASVEQGLEGVVAKRLEGSYEPGRRTGAWVKVKNKRRQELVIGGWMPGEGRRENRIGALLVGYHDADGKLRYAGRVGTGFKERDLEYLEKQLASLRRKTSPFSGGPKPPSGAIYVKPGLVCEVEFTEWTREMILRHPVYKGLVDIDQSEVVLGEEEARVDTDEGPAAPAGEGPAAATDTVLGPMRELKKGAVEVTVDGRDIRLSNLAKVMYPKVGFTKGQVIDYYARVSPALLPHLHGRPLTMKRYPDGVEGQFFYEKQCPSHRPAWVETAAIWSRHNKRNIDFCLVNNLPTLTWAANLADLELHTSLSLAAAVDRPTMMVFDLDPGEPATIVQCCKVGLRLRELFDELGLESFAKTSGSKGLQVYVPLNVEVTYAETKPFAKAVAELLEKQHPKLVVSRMTKSLRGGKVLVDWSQNDDHKTTVCVYSLRAKERPTVSTPVTWDEVERGARSRSAKTLVFESHKVLERMDEMGDLFAPVLTVQQELPAL